MLHQVCQQKDKQTTFRMIIPWIDQGYAVLRHISKTYQVVWLSRSFPLMASPSLFCLSIAASNRSVLKLNWMPSVLESFVQIANLPLWLVG